MNLISSIKSIRYKLFSEQRNKNLVQNVSMNLIYKIIGVLLSYLTVPLTINYLNIEQYGIWITLTSLISWSSFVDLGIGNGLRNKLTESLTKEKYKDAKEYISTAYVLLSGIVFCICIFGVIVIRILNWNKIFNTYTLSNSQLIMLVTAVFIIYLINFVLSLCNQLFYAIHKASFTGLCIVMQNMLIFISIITLRNVTNGSLVSMAIAYNLCGTLSYIILTCYFFKLYKLLKPSLKSFNNNKVKDILSLGVKFFILQLSGIIVFATDNMIITQVIGPKSVTQYNVAQKLFNIISMGYSILLAPLWPAFTEAYIKKDIRWIKAIIYKLSNSLLVVGVIVIILNIFYKPILSLWIGNNVNVPRLLIIFMGIYALISSWNNIYAYFLAGTGILNISVCLSILGGIINVPLSFYFASRLNLGSSGVILATIVTLLPSTIIQPIQTYIIVKDKFKDSKLRKILYN